MSRWDDASFDSERFNLAAENEEIRLLKKFEDYKKLEQLEFEKRNSPKLQNTQKSRVFGRYLHAMAVIQGIIIAGFSTALMYIEYISTDTKFSMMTLAAVALAAEIVIISIYLRKKAQKDEQEKSFSQFASKTEFDGI